MASLRTSLNPLVDEGIVITGAIEPAYMEVLTPDALRFVADLARRFSARRGELLKLRAIRQHEIDAGHFPDFLPETRPIREATWRVAPIPRDLEDRRVEITGPVDRKMVINALNSGANTYMADFEDSNSPTWENCVLGQVNLRDAVRRTIQYTSPEGKQYALGETTAALLVRPRGWHLDERHMRVDGNAVPGGLFDFGLFFFHNAEELMSRGSGPYFYLPKMESHLEARLWNDVFVRAQETMGIAKGTIRATVLIETILAAFEMDEILYELREHSSGLNCGRWDYIFSFIKRFRNHAAFVLPDRATVGMDRHFLKSYVDLLIKTCHRRGIHAMGGMAAQIPIKNDPAANDAAIEKVRADKLREVRAGHDGTWVAHPGLVPVAKEIFDTHMKTPNQIRIARSEVDVTAEDLIAVPDGTITEQGLRTNINIGVLYLESWLRGSGCVPLYNLMEDAATAEISRAQVWQWVRHDARMDDGRTVTRDLVHAVLREEMARIRAEAGEEAWAAGRFETASKLFAGMMTNEEFAEFMPSLAYEFLK
ncbi:MAG: malate synthase A [Candidatus Krumholzibacteria bacterium]|nr:malate synthase A [Candidatus Krumholzibacteria bacterium]MDH4337087.1 malate synthase A [Candidatus Krumholzibacteria bacterium]MDH5268624.1 malate synthase A [Candidatus Krumholzibacteria bacterium]